MSEELYNVEGHKDLARDPKTGSIINVNNMDYNKYVIQRSAKSIRNEDLNTMNDDLDNFSFVFS